MWALRFQSLDAGPMFWALHLSSNILTWFCLCEINPGFSLFIGLGYIVGADSTIPYNRKQQVCLIDNYSGSQSFSLEIVSKRARGICRTKTKIGFVSFGPPWSIIGSHSDNVRHDAPVWSRILPSLILFKKVTATSMLYLKILRRRTLPVWFRILSSSILFNEVTATENLYSLDDFLVVKSSIKRRITIL